MLEKDERLSVSQMKLLDLLGHNPELTDKELAKYVGFKYYNYVSTVKNTILKKRGYLSGPNYWIDLSQISYNKVERILFFIMFPKEYSYSYLISTLRMIKCWSFFYPLEEGAFNEMLVAVYNTDSKSLIKIFDYLKDEGIIFYYSKYLLDGQLDIYNPYFIENCGKEIKKTPVFVDSMPFEKEFHRNFNEKGKKDTKLSLLDTRLIMYLQTSYFNGELSKLMKKDAKILDKNGNRPYLFGYNAWRYSFEKLKECKIVKKYYSIFPVPKTKCAHFFLLLKGDNLEKTKKIAANIGATARTLRAGSFVTSLNEKDYNDFYWCVHIRCHPLYKERIMGLLDNPAIKNKIRYTVRTISYHNNKTARVPHMNYYTEQSVSLEEEFFDFKKQILYYNYSDYLKMIKRTL
ncbi:MAG: MarR family transcriptional regulator [Candidatus Methanofastidiosia archaeon]